MICVIMRPIKSLSLHKGAYIRARVSLGASDEAGDKSTISKEKLSNDSWKKKIVEG